MTRLTLLVITEVATFLHACEGDAVTKLSQAKIPYFNAPIYLENKTQIGKVDEIFGAINESVCVHSLCGFLLSLVCLLILSVLVPSFSCFPSR